MANPTEGKRVTFSYNGPVGRSINVVGDFCDWQTDRCPMKKDKTGVWKATIVLAPGRYEYLFVVDGQWVSDPNCVERAKNAFGGDNCVLYVI
jgi:1,4-alpha-glucan branching enzyme